MNTLFVIMKFDLRYYEARYWHASVERSKTRFDRAATKFGTHDLRFSVVGFQENSHNSEYYPKLLIVTILPLDIKISKSGSV
jgi:hypothetical protein